MLDEALLDTRGSRFRVNKPTSDLAEREANFIRMRIHQARKLDRDKNREVYEPGHKMHGCSPYDAITVRIKNIAGEVFLYLEQQMVNVSAGEALSALPELEYEPPAQIEYQPVRQIEDRAVEILLPKIVRRL